MSKIFLFFPVFLFSFFLNLPYTFTLKKDEIAKFKIYYDGKSYDLVFRWTLCKNNVLIVLYNYDTFPYQITLFNDFSLNFLKMDIAKYPDFTPKIFITAKTFNEDKNNFEIDVNQEYREKIQIEWINNKK